MALLRTVDVMTETTFGIAFRKERQSRNVTLAHLSKSFGKSQAEIRDWEKGKSYPTGTTLKQVYKWCPALRAYEADIREAKRKKEENTVLKTTLGGAIEAKGKVLQLVPNTVQKSLDLEKAERLTLDVSNCASFGAALRTCRTEERLKQADVGDLVGVRQGAVCSWEKGGSLSEDAYDKLLLCFPELAQAPVPTIRRTVPVKSEAPEEDISDERLECLLIPPQNPDLLPEAQENAHPAAGTCVDPEEPIMSIPDVTRTKNPSLRLMQVLSHLKKSDERSTIVELLELAVTLELPLDEVAELLK